MPQGTFVRLLSDKRVFREVAANHSGSGVIANKAWTPSMERAGKHRSDFFWYVLIGLLVVFANWNFRGLRSGE